MMQKTTTPFFRLTQTLLLTLFFITSFTSSANALTKEESSLKDSVAQLKQVDKQLKSGKYDNDDLTKWTGLTIDVGSASNLCVAKKTEDLKKLNKTIEGIGEKTKGEATSVTQTRKDLLKDKNKLDQIIAECNSYILTSKETTNLLNEAKQTYLENKFLARKPHIGNVLYDFIINPVELLADSTEFIWKYSGVRELSILEWTTTLLIVGFALLASYRIRKYLLNIESQREWNSDLDNLLFRAFLTTSAKYLPWIASSFSASLILFFQTNEVKHTPFIVELAYSLTLYFLVIAIVSLILAPSHPAKPFLTFMGDTATKLSRRLKILFLLILIGHLAFYTVFSENLPESNLLLLRYIFTLFIVINLIWAIRAIVKSPKLPNLHWVARAINLILMFTLIAEWLGYVNLSLAVRHGTLITFTLLVTSFAASNVFHSMFNTMDEGSRRWAKRIHKTLGVETGKNIPGLIWVRLTTTIMIWSIFIFLVINTWDISGGILAQAKGYVINGFQIGDFRIVPGKIVWALLIFAGFLTLAGWVKSQLENNWLKMTNMESGARDALVTIVGYIMFMFAALAGLAAAGFDFGNIAIIAGALSVGIGFGLQNIVNNFVSGLILLFERPIRKGDWVVVGGTEGFVQNIQIRSTLIRTFDQSDVIVPNSELISNQVTNWMLSSKKGRAIIPVGVAYGSNIEQVRDILLDIAKNNENVIQTGHRIEPRVLFREFGDSSLNFELRVFLKEIEGRLGIISDLNFAIDKAFREANIEIPFPQRDVHVRTLPDKDDG